jgi:hypothetical protein
MENIQNQKIEATAELICEYIKKTTIERFPDTRSKGNYLYWIKEKDKTKDFMKELINGWIKAKDLPLS